MSEMRGRRKTRPVKVKGVVIGGEAPVSIQSMTKTDTADIEATARQIRALATAGCEIVRVAVPTIEAAKALPDIRREANKVPLVADIHFHPQFAIAAIEAGFDKIRWNPGNIRDPKRIRGVVDRATERATALLFAGATDGSFTAANPISEVLAQLQVILVR